MILEEFRIEPWEDSINNSSIEEELQRRQGITSNNWIWPFIAQCDAELIMNHGQYQEINTDNKL